MTQKIRRIDLIKIAAFRGQFNRVSPKIVGADEVKKLYAELSDEAVSLLFDFALAVGGLDLDAAKIPLAVGMAKISEKRATSNYMRSVISIQLDMRDMPPPYKQLILQFLEKGYREMESKKYVRKLVLYYLRTDKSDPAYGWVNFDYLAERMKRTENDRETRIQDFALGEYFMSLYANAHTAVGRLKRMAYALASGARPHNLAKQVAKDDRFYNLYVEDRKLDQDTLNIDLVNRFAAALGLDGEYQSSKKVEQIEPYGRPRTALEIAEDIRREMSGETA